MCTRIIACIGDDARACSRSYMAAQLAGSFCSLASLHGLMIRRRERPDIVVGSSVDHADALLSSLPASPIQMRWTLRCKSPKIMHLLMLYGRESCTCQHNTRQSIQDQPAFQHCVTFVMLAGSFHLFNAVDSVVQTASDTRPFYQTRTSYSLHADHHHFASARFDSSLA